jgi:hypothetical protein
MRSEAPIRLCNHSSASQIFDQDAAHCAVPSLTSHDHTALSTHMIRQRTVCVAFLRIFAIYQGSHRFGEWSWVGLGQKNGPRADEAV